MLNIEKIRSEFPILQRKIHDKPLVYLDNAATTLKPKTVLDFIYNHDLLHTANIHRGVYELSEKASQAYEKVRGIVQKFIYAKSEKEIIFTHGTTESINLVASSFGDAFLKEGDEILISAMEHHSNIVPWQMLCEKKGCSLKIIPMNLKGELVLDHLDSLLTIKTKLLSLVYVSNSLGTINPVKEIIKKAHEKNIPVLLDAAQAISFLDIDVQDLDCDFLVFSSHKLFGPTGVGVLYAKTHFLEKMPPYMGGGDMIASVRFEKTTYNTIPHKFEAGTPNITGVIGMGHAIEFVQNIGLKNIRQHEGQLLEYASQQLKEIKGLRIIGEAQNKVPIISFVFEDIHPHDIGTLLDQEGIAVRTGHHCTQPIMEFFQIPATARASFSLYNQKSDIDALVNALHKIKGVFQ